LTIAYDEAKGVITATPSYSLDWGTQYAIKIDCSKITGRRGLKFETNEKKWEFKTEAGRSLRLRFKYNEISVRSEEMFNVRRGVKELAAFGAKISGLTWPSELLELLRPSHLAQALDSAGLLNLKDDDEVNLTLGDFDDPFLCAICMETCEEPATATCGAHNFCSEHLKKWVSQQSIKPGGAKCPVCNTKIQQNSSEVRVNTGIRSAIINSAKMSAIIKRIKHMK
jgi:hypothetical protein